jgi:glycosyltransferase involved in cell wall biosynthesis
MTPRIGLVAHWDWVLHNFRLSLADGLREAGAEVVLICPPGSYSAQWDRMGYHYHPWNTGRRGVNPLKEGSSLIALARTYRREQLDAVYHFTVKPVIYGSLAARLAGTQTVINTLSGLGYLFSDDSRARVARVAARPLLRQALLRRNAWLILENEGDTASLQSLGLLPEGRTTMIPGSGVDLSRFHPSTAAADPSKIPMVLMAARLLRTKGVEEFVRCASELRDAGVEARFVVAGTPDEGNPHSIPHSTIEAWSRTSPVEFVGQVDDLAPIMRDADIAVLPTTYPEGAPRFLLGAAACGLPAVATDLPGCRFAVRHAETGYLYPPDAPGELTRYVSSLLSDRSSARQFGERASSLASQEFSQASVVQAYLDVYRSAGDLALA